MKQTLSEQIFLIHIRLNDKTPERTKPVHTDQGNWCHPDGRAPTLLLGWEREIHFSDPYEQESWALAASVNPEVLLGGSSPYIASVHIIFINVSNLSLSWGATAVSLSWLPTRPARLGNTHYWEHLTTSSSSWVSTAPKSQGEVPPNPEDKGTSFPPPHTAMGQLQPRNQPLVDNWCSNTLPAPAPSSRHQTGPQSELKAGRRPIQ